MNKKLKNIIKFSIYSILFIITVFIFLKLGVDDSYAIDSKSKYLEDYILNPDWIEYNELSDEKKKDLNVIPEKYIYRYKKIDTGIKLFSFRNNYPEYYNLIDYGQSTFPENQRSLGICWAFAGVSSAETYLLKNGLSNISNPVKLSVRQLDYATVTSNYISEGYNPYAIPVRTYPGSGAYANSAFALMATGISPVTTEKYGYFDEDKGVKSLNEVINLDNVEYTVDSYVNYGSLDDNSTAEERKAWVMEIKNHVMNYGSVSLNTISPLAGHGGSCSFKDNSNNYLINDKGECNPLDINNKHAMAIIGWDDNYEYKYCRLNDETSKDLTNCDNIVSGKGAFILKNSWGDTYPYPYFSYDSNVLGSYGVTGMSLKNWDTNYDMTKIYDSSYEYQTSTITYYKSNEIEEKLEKISFYSNSRKTVTYKIYVNSNNNYVEVGEVTTNNVGLNTIEVEDIYLKDNKFSIKITSDYGYVDQIYAFTSYIDETIDIEVDTNLRTGTEYSSNIDDFSLYTIARNIEPGTKIEYKLIDEDGNDISNLITVKNNYVVNNVVKPKISINGGFPIGSVNLQTIYNEDIYDSVELKIVNLVNLWAGGTGDIDNPFLIDKAEDFRKIFTNDEYMRAHYKLVKDLDFSNITGWNSGSLSNYQSFSGSIDGDNHKIIGLKGDSMIPSLFYKTDGATIKNIIFSDIEFNLEESSWGNLITVLAYNSNFENIIIANTVTIKGESSNAGGIVATAYNSSFINIFNYGNVSSEYKYHGKIAGIVLESFSSRIEECYNYGNILGTYSIAGGLVSYFGNDSNGNVGSVKNSYNMGKVSSDLLAGGIVGEGENTYIDSVYNISQSTDINDNFYNIVASASGMVIKNSYYLANSKEALSVKNNSTLINVMAKTNKQMKEQNTYLNFDFDNIWTIDNSYPYLKNIYYYYLDNIETEDNITLNLGEEKTIEVKYIPNKVINNKLKYEIENNDIITIKDNKITAIKAGKTILKIYTTDDSNIVKTINITVNNEKINLNDYEIEEDKYIKINSNLNKDNFINSIKNNNSYNITITGNQENIATGNKIEIYNKEGKLEEEYIISVLGDVTGTGNINVSDVAKLYQYIKGTINMEKEFIIASDVVHDNQLKVNDVAKLYQYIKKSIESLEE